jgi:prepilin-type N-terminal cleavage/methylation domain-containing protein
MMKKKEGFTLLELLLVIAIIGVVSAFFVNNFLNTQRRARDNRRKADLNSIASALEKYYAAIKEYPLATTTKSSTDSQQPWITGLTYIYTGNAETIPYVSTDPKNSSTYRYTYTTDLTKKKFILWANLENDNDPERYDKPNAKCTNAATSPFDYCVTSPMPFTTP